ncbi:hypothetical protein [Amorphus orientalis]|uniref:Uncharacterized protein n=1 Tax=Amorphus orientalis TaxID=649198 RepID=A0AAE3VSG2_9HYPH|nr:hypothetical protein [Amorphus orientalis]MDQ0317362.1 hypothetical protein [Amorphus orientalis]
MDNNVVIYDLAFSIQSGPEIKRFLSNPKQFLIDLGVMDKLPDFNGVRWYGGSEVSISDIEDMDIDDVTIMCHHVPVVYQNYCFIECRALK